MRAIITAVVLVAFFASVAHAQGTHSSAVLRCSPAPCTLPPTLASEGTGFVTDPAIAASPKNSEQLLLGSLDSNCTGPSNVGGHLSTNSGSIWTVVDCMPMLKADKLNYTAVDEPHAGYDLKGNAYSAGVYEVLSGKGRWGLVAVQRSKDGTTWGSPVPALVQPGNTNFYLSDMSVDDSSTSPWGGAVYVSGVFVSDAGADTQVWVSHSNDEGSTWTQAPVDSAEKYPDEDSFTRIAIGKNGTVYLTWLTNKTDPAPIMFSTSNDGGKTWSVPRRIMTVSATAYLPNTGERAYDYPSIAVDNSNGPNTGNLYVTMYNWTGTFMQVFMIRSTDGGKTWSEPVALAPKSDTHDQFFPAISVNKDGLVGVSWLDRRNDPKDIDYQAFAAISYDGGQTFGSKWQLTTAFSNPETGNVDWVGDYTGNTWVDDKFVAAWMDTSNGSSVQIVVGGVQLK